MQSVSVYLGSIYRGAFLKFLSKKPSPYKAFWRETCDKIKQYEELCDEYSQEAVDAFLDRKDEDSLDSFKDCYYREAKDEEDFAWDYVHEMYDLSKMQGLENYINYKKFADDLFEEVYYFDNGFVFRSS